MSASCARCGLPATYPGAAIDQETAQCALCRAAGDRTWPSAGEAALRRLLDPAQTKEAYVCLVSYSGGKDSTYMLARLAALYPGRILAFTYDTTTMSPHVWDNIRRVVDRLGVTWVRFSPPAELMKRVFRGALADLIPLQRKKTIYARGTVEFGPLCYACGTLYNLMAIRTAAMYEVPFVVTGFTPAQDSTHYPLTHGFLSKPSELHAELHEARAGGLPARDYVRMAEPMLRLLESATSAPEILPFRVRPGEALDRLRVLRFYDYVAYDETEVRDGAVAVGFEAPPDTGYGSTNCRLNPLIRYVYSSLYGADKYLAQDAALVRWGFGTRSDVLRRATALPTAEEVAPLFTTIGTTPGEFQELLGGVDAAATGKDTNGAEMSDRQANEDPTETVRRFLAQEFPNAKASIEAMSVDQSLIELGVLDSLSLLMIVMFLETTWDFKVPPPDFVPEHFETLARIRSFVEARRGPANANANANANRGRGT